MIEPPADTFEDIPRSSTNQALPQNPHLFLVLECDRPMSGGARYCLADYDEVVIGRGDRRSGNAIPGTSVRRLRINVPGRSMSGLHARIVRNDQGYWLEDLESTNGSFVNGRRVTRELISDADVIELGHTIFLLRSKLSSPSKMPVTYDCVTDPPEHSELATLRPDLAQDFATLARVAVSDVPVILAGETGTGKERIARAIHRMSKRRGGLIAVNCGALSSNLVESQLFGHVKGSFSGASCEQLGFVRSAQHGTLLLDEVGELPMSAQVALLRVLQEQEVVPVGAAHPIRVDVRIIAATHRPLEAMVERGQFRADLFSRLNGFCHRLPSLRARREDLGLMIAEILASTPCRAPLTPEAGLLIALHPWPYNVRELVQHFRRAVALAENDIITASDLALSPSTSNQSAESAAPGRRHPTPATPGNQTDTRLKQQLVDTLKECGGNVSEAARVLGKARMQIQRWMKRFGIDASEFRSPVED